MGAVGASAPFCMPLKKTLKLRSTCSMATIIVAVHSKSTLTAMLNRWESLVHLPPPAILLQCTQAMPLASANRLLALSHLPLFLRWLSERFPARSLDIGMLLVHLALKRPCRPLSYQLSNRTGELQRQCRTPLRAQCLLQMSGHRTSA